MDSFLNATDVYFGVLYGSNVVYSMHIAAAIIPLPIAMAIIGSDIFSAPHNKTKTRKNGMLRVYSGWLIHTILILCFFNEQWRSAYHLSSLIIVPVVGAFGIILILVANIISVSDRHGCCIKCCMSRLFLLRYIVRKCNECEIDTCDSALCWLRESTTVLERHDQVLLVD
jgi:hypothetical protein